MVHALFWFVVATVLALWSLTAWALHAAAVWTLSQAGALSGATAGAASLPWPTWLTPWIPPELAQTASQWLTALAPAVDTVLQAAPALTGGLTVVAWVIWALGSVALVLLGAAGHALITLWRRRAGQPPAPGAGRTLVAG
ncbi:MAG: hypothetical protein RL375_3514 [Pseudomonadota bacterium]|jgi:hypothetical protein